MNIFSITQMLYNAMEKPKQYISLGELPKGKVIDIDGGGEGVIGQAGGNKLYANLKNN